jgi:hypothetical protein
VIAPLALTPLALALLLQPAPAEEPVEEPAPQQRPPGGLGTMRAEEPVPVDPDLIEGRRRPGFTDELPDPVSQTNDGAVRAPPPEAFPTDTIPIPDRWRLIENLGLVVEDPLDPYNQNTYKGDRPICIPSDEEQERRRALREAAEAAGEEPPYGSAVCRTPKFLGLKSPGKWFFVTNLISDTVFEPRSFPIPVGVQTTADPNRLDVFRRQFQLCPVADLHCRFCADQGQHRLQAARCRIPAGAGL